MNDYRQIVIETYRNLGEPSRQRVRARPLPGQGLSVDLKVECSSSMRERHAVGTRFIVQCKLTDCEGGTPFLYTSYQWPYQVVTVTEAEDFICKQHGKELAHSHIKEKGWRRSPP